MTEFDQKSWSNYRSFLHSDRMIFDKDTWLNSTRKLGRTIGHFFHIFFSIFEFSSIVLEYSRTVFESLRNGFFKLGFLLCGLFTGCSRFPFPSNGHVTSSDPNIRVGKVFHFTSSFTYQKILYSLALQRGDFWRDIL